MEELNSKDVNISNYSTSGPILQNSDEHYEPKLRFKQLDMMDISFNNSYFY